jgi:hypothetical protein
MSLSCENISESLNGVLRHSKYFSLVEVESIIGVTLILIHTCMSTI